MSTQNTIFGILGGIAVGAIAGILLAPDKGEKTRKKIATKATDLKNDLAKNVEATKGDLSEKLEVLKNAGNEIIDKSKSELSKVKSELAS